MPMLQVSLTERPLVPPPKSIEAGVSFPPWILAAMLFLSVIRVSSGLLVVLFLRL